MFIEPFNPWSIKLVSMTDQCDAKTEPERKKENPMYVDFISNDKHTESAKVNYLLQRAQNVQYKQRIALYKQFGLEDDDTPKDAKETVDRIIAGKYTLPTDRELELIKERQFFSWSPLIGIRWRDPAVKEDRDGFKAAEKELDATFDTVHDAVMVKSNDDALAAIKTFETWKTTVTPAV